MAGCAYRLGAPDRGLPGGYKQVTVPVFKNWTMEPGLEVYFTNAFIQEIERSRIARLVTESEAEVVALGEIQSVQYSPGGKREGGSLPTGAVLAAEYRILITAKLKLLKKADKSLLWEGVFKGERTYVAPQVTAAGVNTVNPLYNLSARRQNIEVIAGELMAEAHTSMTENF